VKQHPRVRDITRQGPSVPPVVKWRCAGPQKHLMLRVFITREGWHVLGEGFRIPLPEWLERSGIGEHVTVDEYRERRASLSNARRVEGVDRELPLNIDNWPADEQFEVGCRCGHKFVGVAELAADCRHARDSSKPVVQDIEVP
jgi:hypothetical protein